MVAVKTVMAKAENLKYKSALTLALKFISSYPERIRSFETSAPVTCQTEEFCQSDLER